MHAPLASGHPLIARQRLAEQHRANVAACKPLLDPSIPLGLPEMEDQEAVRRYFRAKHRRGEFGTYWPLHQVNKGFDAMRPIRRKGHG